jgi:hypothetical protein
MRFFLHFFAHQIYSISNINEQQQHRFPSVEFSSLACKHSYKKNNGSQGEQYDIDSENAAIFHWPYERAKT